MKNNMEAENVVLLHDETDDFCNVDIPKPESLAKKQQRASKRSKSNNSFPVRTYIYIDDDDDDEIPVIHHDSKLNDAAKYSPVKLSKDTRTYQGRGKSNGDSSSDNVSECELKVDLKGMLQKLWERASLKKKACVQSESDSKQVFVHKDEKSKEIPSSNKMENEAKRQAEEAQRVQNMQKRKEAEKSRLLDIERKQKQRVEEIRETEKKVEENMKLKEIYRTKVQQDLKILEMTCHDMASLLCGLGILVDNSLNASPNQIRAAYKQALLRFHPDRALGTDMHQQVEAEEKFKLISRMRDNDKFGFG